MVRAALSYFATYDGDAHSRHVRRRDQGYSRVERYEPGTVIHAWLLEPHFCVAQGMS